MHSVGTSIGQAQTRNGLHLLLLLHNQNPHARNAVIMATGSDALHAGAEVSSAIIEPGKHRSMLVRKGHHESEVRILIRRVRRLGIKE